MPLANASSRRWRRESYPAQISGSAASLDSRSIGRRSLLRSPSSEHRPASAPPARQDGPARGQTWSSAVRLAPGWRSNFSFSSPASCGVGACETSWCACTMIVSFGRMTMLYCGSPVSSTLPGISIRRLSFTPRHTGEPLPVRSALPPPATSRAVEQPEIALLEMGYSPDWPMSDCVKRMR